MIMEEMVLISKFKVSSKNNITYLFNEFNGDIFFLTTELYTYIKKYYPESIFSDTFVLKFHIDDQKYVKTVIDGPKEFIRRRNHNVNDIHAHLVITNQCNLKCIHCSTESEATSEYMDYKKIFILLHNIKKMNISKITISGGEPLLYDHFFELIRLIKNRLPYVELILSTNGTLISEQNVKFLIENFVQIDISLDGYDEDSCSKIRGVGVFEKVMDSIKKLKYENFHNVIVSSVFKKDSDKEKNLFINMCKENNISYKIRTFIPIGRGKLNHEVFIGDEDVIPISIPELYRIKGDRNEILVRNCGAGKRKIYIDFDGSIYPCHMLKSKAFELSNILDKKYSDTDIINFSYNVKNKMSFINEFNNTGCRDCNLNIFCWCCPGLFISIYNENKVNKWCNLMRDNLERIVWGG